MEVWVKVAPRRQHKALARLFIFPHAGAGPSSFLHWAKHLPQEIEVCAIQLPGREARIEQNTLTDIHVIVRELAPCIFPYLDLPFIFFGHSMGALVGFELARHLESSMKLFAEHLFVSGHRAPHLPERHPPIHNLPTLELIEEIRRMNGTDELIFQNTELMQITLPILRADLTACETYKHSPGQSLHCPITAFGGLSDEQANPPEIDAWRTLTSSSFQMQIFEGGHFYFNRDLPGFLKLLSQELKAICRVRYAQ